jgi:membrane-bound serine protease (ClpP class)
MVTGMRLLSLLVSLVLCSQLVAQPADLQAQLREHIQFDPDGENLVGHLMIGKEGINQSTWIYVKQALDLYKEKKPIFIILELNSPGGEVFASQQISDALKDMDTDYGIPVVAFIDNWAISAGAMLAYSSRFIGITKDAAMGAAEPIIAAPQQGPQTAGEKITSALRADFANRAAFFDRNPLIAEAMVDKEIVLVQRRGEIVRLDNMDQVRSGDKLISAEGKLLTLKATELLEYGVADFQIPPTAVIPLTGEEESAGEYPASRSLLFQYPFFKEIPNAKILAYRMDWKTKFFAFLAHPMVASLLFLGLMLGFYIEMSTPGFGLPGSVALGCLFLIILSSFALEAVHWLEMILLLVGLVLIAIEVFVIPGFGVVGVLGLILATVGLVALMLPGLRDIQWDFDTGHLNEAGRYVLERAAWLGGAIIIGVVAMVLLSRFVLPKFSHFSRLVLRGEQEGYIGTPDVSKMPNVGSEGVTLSTLRPAGKVEIDGVVYDVVSTGVFIDPGKRVRIARYEGSRMVVEELE